MTTPLIDRLKLSIEQLHNCAAHYSRTQPVLEVFDETTLWHGDVEVFDLVGHPQARRAYGWSHGGHGEGEQLEIVLEIRPVNSPRTAVRASILADLREEK
jgi:hypothetical protein